MRTYDHVKGFEFIEMDPSLPYPVSSAYKKTPDGAKMLVRNAGPDLAELSLSENDAAKLISDLDDAGLFDWRRVYKPVQGNFVVTVTQWRLQVDFDEDVSKRTSSMVAEGSDEFPDGFDHVVGILVDRWVEG